MRSQLTAEGSGLASSVLTPMCGRGGVPGVVGTSSLRACKASTSRRCTRRIKNGTLVHLLRAGEKNGRPQGQQEEIKKHKLGCSVRSKERGRVRRSRANRREEEVAWTKAAGWEMQSNKRLDEQRRNLQRQMRDIDKLTHLHGACGQRSPKGEVCVSFARSRREKDRPSAGCTRKCRRGRRSCKACRTRKSITSWRLVQVKKKCKKKSTRIWQRCEHASRPCRRSRVNARGLQAKWNRRFQILQAREEGRGSCASQSNGCCFFSRWEQHRHCSSSPFFVEKSAEYMAGNIGQSQPLRSEGQEQKRRRVGKKIGMMRGRPMGGLRVPLLALQWILLMAQTLSVGALGRGNPSTPRNGTRVRDSSRSLRGKKRRKAIKWEVKSSRHNGEKGRVGERKEAQTAREKDPSKRCTWWKL